MARAPFSVVLLIAALLLRFGQPGSCDYCSESLAMSSCPNLATYDSVDLAAYGGHWYEIGSSASSKNLAEAGGVCSEAKYTLKDKSTVNVVNTDFVTATPEATAAVAEISGSSTLVCQGARIVCVQANTDDSLLKEGLSKVWKVQSSISGSYPTEAAKVSAAASKIQQAAADLPGHVDQLSKYVTQLQTANSQLSQTDGVDASIVSSMKSVIDLSNAQATSMDGDYKTMADAQMDLIDVAKDLFMKGMDGIEPSLKLTDAATEVLGGAMVVKTQVEGMSAAFTTSTKAADAVLTHKSKPFYNMSSISGSAVVNGSNAKLSVTFTPLPGKGHPGQYWILAVDGSASSGYNAALVYSCVDVPTGGTDQTIWILARSPSLSQDVTNRLLSLATSMGIKQDCNSPFVYTKRSAKCPSTA